MRLGVSSMNSGDLHSLPAASTSFSRSAAEMKPLRNLLPSMRPCEQSIRWANSSRAISRLTNSVGTSRLEWPRSRRYSWPAPSCPCSAARPARRTPSRAARRSGCRGREIRWRRRRPCLLASRASMRSKASTSRSWMCVMRSVLRRSWTAKICSSASADQLPRLEGRRRRRRGGFRCWRGSTRGRWPCRGRSRHSRRALAAYGHRMGHFGQVGRAADRLELAGLLQPLEQQRGVDPPAFVVHAPADGR